MLNNERPIIIIKKKAAAHGGHHGGSWKVAYADFVTAMMAFFLVMWILGLSQESRKAIAAYFNDPTGMMKSLGGGTNPISLNRASSSGKPADRIGYGARAGGPAISRNKGAVGESAGQVSRFQRFEGQYRHNDHVRG